MSASESEQLQTPEWILLLRRLGGVGLIFVGWQIMPLSFWWGIAIAYFGFFLCLVECIYEPWLLHRPYQIQVGCIAILLFFFALFSIQFVSAQAPLVVRFLASDFGVGPTNVHWKSPYTELDVVFENPTDLPYEDFNALVVPDNPVADMGQLSGLPDFSFEDSNEVIARGGVVSLGTGTALNNLVILGTDTGYRIHCGHIPGHRSLKIWMAIVGFNKTTEASSTDFVRSFATSNPDEIYFAVNFSKGGKYWLGAASNTKVYAPHTMATKIHVEGSFKGAYRTREINEEIRP